MPGIVQAQAAPQRGSLLPPSTLSCGFGAHQTQPGSILLPWAVAPAPLMLCASGKPHRLTWFSFSDPSSFCSHLEQTTTSVSTGLPSNVSSYFFFFLGKDAGQTVFPTGKVSLPSMYPQQKPSLIPF